MGNETFYDEEIAPALFELARRCEDRGMSFVAAVEYAPGEIGKTIARTGDVGLAMVMLTHCAKMGVNVDGYIMGLIAYAQENGIDYSGSLYMTAFDKS